MSSVQKNSVYIITGWIAIGLLGCAVLLSVYNKMKSESAGNTIGVQSLTALAVISVGIGLLSVKDATPPSSPSPGTEGGQCRSVKEGSPCDDGLVCRAAGGDMGGVPLCMKPPAPKPPAPKPPAPKPPAPKPPAPGTKGGPCRSQAGGNNNLPCDNGLKCVNDVSDNVSVCMPTLPSTSTDTKPTGSIPLAGNGQNLPKLQRDPMNLQSHENYENFKPTFHGRTEW
jgi:hypothetical protein